MCARDHTFRVILNKPKPLKFSFSICKMEAINPHHTHPRTVNV